MSKYITLSLFLIVLGIGGGFEMRSFDRIERLELLNKSLKDSIDIVNKSNRLLRIERNMFMSELKSIDDKIEYYRNQGFTPDRQLMRFVELRSKQYGFTKAETDSIYEWIKIECSFYPRMGDSGEAYGHLQQQRHMYKQFLILFGVSANEAIKASNEMQSYNNINILEWAFVQLMQTKRDGKFKHVYWNGGY